MSASTVFPNDRVTAAWLLQVRARDIRPASSRTKSKQFLQEGTSEVYAVVLHLRFDLLWQLHTHSNSIALKFSGLWHVQTLLTFEGIRPVKT